MKKIRQKGQSVVEAVIALPVLIMVTAGLGLLFARGILRLELQTLSQELKVCYASTHPQRLCKSRFQTSIAQLPGEFRLVGIQKLGAQFQVEVRHQLPLPPRSWIFEVPH